jgi:hypothetical protein
MKLDAGAWPLWALAGIVASSSKIARVSFKVVAPVANMGPRWREDDVQ